VISITTQKDDSLSTLANIITFIPWCCRVTLCVYYQVFLITHPIDRCIYNAACTGGKKHLLKCPASAFRWIKLALEMLWSITAAEKLDLCFAH